MLTWMLFVPARTTEQESTLTRSYFALKEAILFLESYHRIGFMTPEDEKTMKVLQTLEAVQDDFDRIMTTIPQS